MLDDDQTLMDQSKARPAGPIDWSRFQKKGSGKQTYAEGSVNSNYLQETREQDPWPEQSEQSAEANVVLIQQIRWVDSADQLQTFQAFHFECVAEVLAATPKRKIQVQLMCRYVDSHNQEMDEDQFPQGFEVFLPATQEAGTTYTLQGTGKLYGPNVEAGTHLTYRLQAKHSSNSDAVESAEIEVLHRYPVKELEIPDLVFCKNGCVPTLDAEGWLMDALATALDYAEKEAGEARTDSQGTKYQEELVVVGHADPSGEYSLNYQISQRRAKMIQSLLNQKVEVWKQYAKDYGRVEEYQQILAILTSQHGWDCDPGPVDNRQGPQTKAGVQNFQSQANTLYHLNLSVDGIIGPQTWGAIHRVYCGLMAKALEKEDPSSSAYPLWTQPTFGYAAEEGAYGCGESFDLNIQGEPAGGKSQNRRRARMAFMPRGLLPIQPPPDQNRNLEIEECILTDIQKVVRETLEWFVGTPAPPNPSPTVGSKFVWILPKKADPKQDEEGGSDGANVYHHQYVNLASAHQGRDGKGTSITLKIDMKDNLGKATANRDHFPAEIFVQVIYSAQDSNHKQDVTQRSLRNNPAWGLKDSPLFKAKTLKTPEAAAKPKEAPQGFKPKEIVAGQPEKAYIYTATLAPTAHDKPLTLEVDLGEAGGDTCEIRVGTTAECKDLVRRYVNWRRLEYEMLVPQCITPDLTQTAGKWDFGANLKNLLTQRLGHGFVEYNIRTSLFFQDAKAGKGTVVPSAFLQRNGRARYIFASGWEKPKGVAFTNPRPDRCTQITLCDGAFSSNKKKVRSFKVETTFDSPNPVEQTVESLTGAKDVKLAFPYSTLNGAETKKFKGYKWRADVDQAACTAKPSLKLSLLDGNNLLPASVRVALKLPKGRYRFPTVDLFAEQNFFHGKGIEASIADFINQRQYLNLCAGHLEVELYGLDTEKKENTTLLNEIQKAFDLKYSIPGSEIPMHPGLDQFGLPLEAPAEDHKAIVVTHATYKKLRFELKKSADASVALLPGDLAGKKGDPYACPILFSFKLEATYSIGGSSNGATILLAKNGVDGAVASVIAHELGHSMGLTPFPDGRAMPPGLPMAKHVDNGGTFYLDRDKNFVNGYRNIHRGPHCAAGVPKADLADSKFKGKKGTCIMFGSYDPNVDNLTSYCPECLKYLKAMKLNKIS